FAYPEQPLDMRLQLLRLRGRRESRRNAALAVDEKLRKVPLDALAAEHSRRFFLEPSIQWMCGIAVDVDLVENRKRDAEVRFTEPSDLLAIAWLLRGELIAWKAKHGKSAIAVGPIERFQSPVLWRKAALACGVDDQEHVTCVVTKRHQGTVESCGSEIV